MSEQGSEKALPVDTEVQPPPSVSEPVALANKLRDANEHLTIAALQAQVEAETSSATSEKLRRLCINLEESERALKEKNKELENFHLIVVDRELKMLRQEKDIEQLRQEVARLKGLLKL